MIRTLRLYIFILTSFFFSLKTYASTQDFNKLWFSGRIEDALAHAKKEKKLILLYWGAVWCPPCNELKAEIFSKEDFSKITDSLVRVYIDGDREDAQTWGEKFQASGYPTLLILSPEGKELFRLSNSVNWEEFKDALKTALEAGGTFREALVKAETAHPPASVWKILAYNNWLPDNASAKEKAKSLETRERLIQKIPSEFASEKALLIVGLIGELSEENVSGLEFKEIKARTDKKAVTYLKFLLSSKNTLWASRDILMFNAESLLKWVKKHSSDQEFSELCSEWLKASETLRHDKRASLDLRLWSWFPDLVISRDFNKDKEKFSRVQSSLVQAAKTTEAKAKTAYERHSLIPSIADLLEKAGERKKARELLLTELKKTDTPWYYQSSLARLEEKQGNIQASLHWSHLAKESAKGNATRLQWLVQDLLRNLKLNAKDLPVLKSLIKEYYELAFSLTDGFQGRNAEIAKKIQKGLVDFEHVKEIQETLNIYRQRCPSKKDTQVCEKIFAQLK